MKTQFALVTGSSSGLGLEISHYLLEENYIVFGASRTETDLDHPNFIDLEVDVTDEESVQNMYDEIGKETYGLNLIVNNAGIFEMSPLVNTESEVFLDHLRTNVLGPFHILKNGHEFLIENQTHILTISSIAGKRGFENYSAYCASKFALNGMMEAVQKEWAKLGVRFSTLCPGAIDTPIWDSAGENFDRSNLLDPENFIHVLDMVVKSPVNMQFPEVMFLHKSGFLD